MKNYWKKQVEQMHVIVCNATIQVGTKRGLENG